MKLPEALRKGSIRFHWWVLSVPIYIKILGIGLLITILFATVAFYEIRSRVYQTHYQVHGETALSVATSLALRLQAIDVVHNKAELDRELTQTAAAFPDVRYIVVQDRDGHILSHGFMFPGEAPSDLLIHDGNLCASCHPPLSPKELPSDLLEIPTRIKLPTGGLRAYSRPQGLVLDVTVPIGDGSAGVVRVGIGDKMIARDMTSITRAILLGLALCVIASLCSAIPVMYVLNRPIRALLKATNVVREGDFSVRAPVYSNDEIGQLATAFNRMAAGLADSRRQVFRADKLASIGEFAAGIAHEINNPLDGVMSCLARLQRDPTNLTQNMEYLQMIQHALKRIASVIQRLLEYSQAHDMHLEPEDVHRVIENVVALVSTLARQSAMNLEFEFGEHVPLAVGDRYYLEQALLNLALNAVAAMPNGGTLTFRTQLVTEEDRADQWVAIDVTDTGTGIEPENIQKIFDPFFTTKEPGKGTGLGLAIVREIIEEHRGKIVVESTVGVGTRIRVLLPAASGHSALPETAKGASTV